MNRCTIYIHGFTPVSKYIGQFLRQQGVCTVSSPTPEVTHLLLGVPNRMPKKEVEAILAALPKDVIVAGGYLEIPGIDLLRDEGYLEKNAALTAYCALRLGMEKLPVTPEYCPCLVIGWGRIGKRLSRLLRLLGADVTVASGNEAHRSQASAMGYRVVDSGNIPDLERFRLVYNTAPALILSEKQVNRFREDCVILDLASVPGMEGDRVMRALGLPGKMVPESSGRLIGSTLLQKLHEEDNR